MEQQEHTTQAGVNSRHVISIIFALVGFIAVACISLNQSFGIFDGGKAKQSAEKYIKNSVYTSLGIVPQKISSETIFKDGNVRLIEVRYGLTSGWDGKYCVYTKGEYVVNATTMLACEYSCKGNLEELKALFGV